MSVKDIKAELLKVRETVDQDGDVVVDYETTVFFLEDRDIQPYGAAKGVGEIYTVREDGIKFYDVKRVWLKDENAFLPIELNDLVIINAKKHQVAEIERYPNHLEVILNG
jgi:hypothetical protein